MENKEKIAFVQKELEQVKYNIESFGRILKNEEEAVVFWKGKIETETKRKEILEETLQAYQAKEF